MKRTTPERAPSLQIFEPHQREDVWQLRMIQRAAGPIHGGSSVESGFEPATLRYSNRECKEYARSESKLAGGALIDVEQKGIWVGKLINEILMKPFKSKRYSDLDLSEPQQSSMSCNATRFHKGTIDDMGKEEVVPEVPEKEVFSSVVVYRAEVLQGTQIKFENEMHGCVNYSSASISKYKNKGNKSKAVPKVRCLQFASQITCAQF
ncbi:hypothetical protein AVEN_123125-1 [Araneus ventricosus]|uniref:Uncharacterized protein n=1 Tax=Araneus ventricosus TaxID=182803 RepID=A0A4Y2Q2V4_ARAVE|nr:hypothetical protein AVEN_123125-1 [Araneus ventricosus]